MLCGFIETKCSFIIMYISKRLCCRQPTSAYYKNGPCIEVFKSTKSCGCLNLPLTPYLPGSSTATQAPQISPLPLVQKQSKGAGPRSWPPLTNRAKTKWLPKPTHVMTKLPVLWLLLATQSSKYTDQRS